MYLKQERLGVVPVAQAVVVVAAEAANQTILVSKGKGTIHMATQADLRYLLAILELSQMGSQVKSVEVAGFLGYSRPSVARQLKGLLDKDFIEKEPYGSITLSVKGRKLAVDLHKKYLSLKSFFVIRLGVDMENACKDAMLCACGLTEQSLQKVMQEMLDPYEKEA